ncbi:YhdT family protein [Gemella sp. zg-570]|uniref:YhdT family protein n=1 Tax=Gemella sp. zg-570 TaxID=2840371 RepID=UPI001C0AD88B|nr:YhdT family protein [Gemella sp. zg-570]QWQ38182.1 YhdT family protein [Gemella sp. zg-570]
MNKNKDYVYALILVFIHFSLWYYFAYIRYADIEVKDYKYILGIPEWFFYSSVVTSIFVILLLILFCRKIFSEDISEDLK